MGFIVEEMKLELTFMRLELLQTTSYQIPQAQESGLTIPSHLQQPNIFKYQTIMSSLSLRTHNVVFQSLVYCVILTSSVFETN